ncbi:hypothetical protein PC9H_000832 [Pleurotus ostreatus]|uniref:J domain-containing protein n=1 Tax=Pleurotus ostreatus TaxID=5322 RepID=A0A8H7A4H6_PLEOS|nr:uncharacterized protein PC9H_000832 [Pleurotus ostreatus]KAF7440487.1 hypothetical protein PC9H_000832 [Pleurotus ostreatus]KAJ8700164.1 hypothetical protein PTI98_003216 [Pleurotus ostreatus]
MDDNDPTRQFFPDQDEVDLYDVLSVGNDAKLQEIKKSYRRLALIYHPDKHATADERAKADASVKFQQIGFAYAVLSDEKRRKRYDTTGKTDEGFDMGSGDDGWEAYFADMFDRVTRGKLDEMKKEYQGSAEEIEDLKQAYTTTSGSIGEMMTYIPHSTHEDEDRFILVVSDLINKGDLPSLRGWETSTKDEKSRLVRKKQGEKEAKEAEQMAKDLGVWDEFYGSGKTGKRQGKGKGKDTKADDAEEEDTSVLQALILKKKQKNMDFFDGLAAKYAEPPKKGKGKKRAKAAEDDEDTSPKKKGKYAPPDIDDEEFERLQSQLFSDSKKGTSKSASKKGKRKGKA